jgi:hypothetical protein
MYSTHMLCILQNSWTDLRKVLILTHTLKIHEVIQLKTKEYSYNNKSGQSISINKSPNRMKIVILMQNMICILGYVTLA